MLHNNLLATLITFVLALSWLRIMDYFAHRGWIESRLSRKIIHIGTGPLFVLCWLLFDDQYYARFLAALVPLATTIQFALVGFGILKDDAAVKAMSRTGKREEILRGPLYYGIVFILLTLLFWKDTPLGVISLMILCGGDGVADIIGKKFQNGKLPWSGKKTWAGSLAMFAGGTSLALLVVWLFTLAGVFSNGFDVYFPRIIFLGFLATLVESLPVRDFDNITVPAVIVLVGLFLY
jgi:phytol kinase